MEHSSIEAGAEIAATAPQLRTVESMLEDMRNNPALVPDPLLHQKVKSVLSTILGGEYAETQAKPKETGPAAEKTLNLQTEAQPRAPVILVGPNVPGGSQGGDGTDPPDFHGAIGLDHYVEVWCSYIQFFERNNPGQSIKLSLRTFFNFPPGLLYQPRIVYDSVWNRWVVSAWGVDDNLVWWHFIAVSTTSNALGPYFIYKFSPVFNPGDQWVWPQLGMDQDSIIITIDVYPASGPPRGATMFAVAKARIYNGLGFSVPAFTGLRSPLAPPIVLDQNAKTFLISAPRLRGNSLSLYTLINSSRPNGTQLTGPVDIAVPAYLGPPTAPQPGTGNFLFAGNGDFVNASTQTGDSLWQVHTINLGGYAAPKFYQIDTATNSVLQSAFFYGTSTSYDFNATIAANSNNDIFVTWSMTDPARGTYPQVRFSGFDHNNGTSYALGPGTVAFTSPTWHFYPWGTYSAVTIDPRNPRHAWLVNEYVQPNGDWSTRIVGFGFAT